MIKKLLSRTGVRYLISSVAAFLLDYVLLLFLDDRIPVFGLELGALISWVVSSFTNFNINRGFVFRSDAPYIAALGEYYSLAAVSFVLKTYVLIELMTRVFCVPLAAAKPAAEVIFFVFNYLVQKKFIFRGGKR